MESWQKSNILSIPIFGLINVKKREIDYQSPFFMQTLKLLFNNNFLCMNVIIMSYVY